MAYILDRLDDRACVIEWENKMKENEKFKESFVKYAEQIMKDENTLYVEDMSKEELNELYPEYDPTYDYSIDEDNITCFDSNVIHFLLSKAFDIIMCKLYKYLQIQHPNYKWCQLVREFIWWHEHREYGDLHTLFNMNTDLYFERITTSQKEMDEIKKQGLQMFLGDKCINVNDDNFDGMNDLMHDEWESVNNIILYYYYHEL